MMYYKPKNMKKALCGLTEIKIKILLITISPEHLILSEQYF